MTFPNFSKSVIDTLARRARYQCSSPDCGVHTVGPNSDPQKSTSIGEAAHIMGAQLGSARYDPQMSNSSRSEITNGIWLCRNCHGEVDRDAKNFPAALLFAWRRSHEDRVGLELGTRGERIRYEMEMAPVAFLVGYPPIILRIAVDKPLGWGWRLAAELLQHLNSPLFKRLKNLQAGQYYRPMQSVSRDQFADWIDGRAGAMAHLINPFKGILDRLSDSWGAPSQAADLEEIHETCVLLRDALATIIEFEESLRFVQVPADGEELRDLLVNVLGRDIANLAELPGKLNETVALIDTDHSGTDDEPLILVWEFKFAIPEGTVERYKEAIQRYRSGR